MNHHDGTALIDSPVGKLLLTARRDGLTHLLFADDKGRPIHAPESPCGEDTSAAVDILAETARQLTDYFAGRRREFDLPLDPGGTDFQCAVWSGLRDIPYGETMSYGELAVHIGRPRAVRAVGAANGANPISIIVPCHRVIGKDGHLTGFGGGLSVKKRLLELEGRRVERDHLI